VRQDERDPFVAGLRRARDAAYPIGEHVGQESFMTAGEIRQLADRARIESGTSVLDLCCGIAGPGRLLVAERGCRYLGLDYSASAVEIARVLAGDLPCTFAQAHLPPLPDERFDVVLLLETLLAFRDKCTLFTEVARVLAPGGRFAFTIEAGRPLTASEQAQMPDADTVNLIDLLDLMALLSDVGLSVKWQEQRTASHQLIAAALLKSFRRHSLEIAGEIGVLALQELIAAHELWSDWLRTGRVRKYALVAQKL
jgi:ubiquinone/menaquinone biosynthesis C-methylase UbiE